MEDEVTPDIGVDDDTGGNETSSVTGEKTISVYGQSLGKFKIRLN
jgi:hypothetical protein